MTAPYLGLPDWVFLRHGREAKQSMLFSAGVVQVFLERFQREDARNWYARLAGDVWLTFHSDGYSDHGVPVTDVTAFVACSDADGVARLLAPPGLLYVKAPGARFLCGYVHGAPRLPWKADDRPTWVPDRALGFFDVEARKLARKAA